MKSFLLIIILISSFILTGCGNKEINDTNTNDELEKDQSGNESITSTKGATNINANEIASSIKQKNSSNMLGTAHTELLDDTESRVNNISITCNAINNHIVGPDQIFSFNEVVGSADSSKGYEEATVLDSEGNKTQGLGGGNCQVSTTLYNAVLDAGLEVVERYEHSRDVAYVDEGLDAAISYSSDVDFRFKNNTSNNIQISASTDGKIVNVTIRSM